MGRLRHIENTVLVGADQSGAVTAQDFKQLGNAHARQLFKHTAKIPCSCRHSALHYSGREALDGPSSGSLQSVRGRSIGFFMMRRLRSFSTQSERSYDNISILRCKRWITFRITTHRRKRRGTPHPIIRREASLVPATTSNKSNPAAIRRGNNRGRNLT